MDYIFYTTTAINGFDGISHYLRAALITNLCSSYAIGPVNGCNANFRATKAVNGKSAAGDPTLAKLRDALARGIGKLDGKGTSGTAGTSAPQGQGLASAAEAERQLRDPKLRSQSQQGVNRIRSGAQRGQSPYFDQNGGPTPEEQALDYLLGSDK
jgi:hypothetical protein